MIPDARLAPLATPTNVVSDGNFEAQNAHYWKQCGNVKAIFTTSESHGGKYSEFGGTVTTPEINGTAAVCQKVTVPANGRLQFWVRQDTNDSTAAQGAEVIGENGIVKTLYFGPGATNGWEQRGPYNLSSYAGQKITLKFSVEGRGSSIVDPTFVNQYVDDVSLTDGALPSPPSPSPSPIPGDSPIKHIVIVLQENRTFDDIFHGYPGANYAKVGVGPNGKSIALHETHLMTPWDPAHSYEEWRVEYDNGLMDGFAYENLDGGRAPFKNFAYSYAMQQDVQPYWDLAKEGVLADNMFADHRSRATRGICIQSLVLPARLVLVSSIGMLRTIRPAPAEAVRRQVRARR